MTVRGQRIVSVTVPIRDVSYDAGDSETRISFDGGELVLRSDRRRFLRARRLEASSKRCGRFSIVLLEDLRRRRKTDGR